MHKDLVVKKAELEQSTDVWDYLYILLDKYLELQAKEPDNIVDNFNDDQHSLYAYMKLDAEVCNGGFIQLIYNGYTEFIFESPFIDTLERWGISKTADLLKQVRTIYEVVDISQDGHDDLNDFADLYEQYPQFDEYDEAYYNMKEEDVLLVKEYVEKHLDQFIKTEE